MKDKKAYYKRVAHFRQYLLMFAILICSIQTTAQTATSNDYIQKLTTANNAKDTLRLYRIISVLALREGKAIQAEQYAKKMLALGEKVNIQLAVAQAYFCISDSYFNRDQNDTAKYYAQKCIDAYDEAGKKGLYYTYALNAIAAYYLDKGDASKALAYGQKQMNVAVEKKDTASISNSYTMLCAIYDLLDDTKNSIKYAEKALELNRLTDAVYNRSIVLTNLASLYTKDGQNKKSLPLLYESMQLVEFQTSTKVDRARSYMLLGSCYTELGNTDSANKYLQKANKLADAVEKPEDAIKTWVHFARMYFAQKNYEKALLYVDKSAILAKEKELVKLYSNSTKLKSDILAEQGNYKDAYRNYQQYNNIKDSISNVEIQKSIATLQEKYESDKKDREIMQQRQVNIFLKNESLLKDQKLKSELLLRKALLAKNELANEQIIQDSILSAALGRENVLKKKQLAQANKLNTTLKEESKLREMTLESQRKANLLLIIGICSLLALGVWIFSLYRKQKTANNIIQEQSNKLTYLMKELHHRVKNNLQIISSLLSLQSFKIKDLAASKAVREGQQRIEAMSLIHQRLYTRDNITEINIKEFISDLVDSLQSAYGYSKDDFTIKLDIDNELMNVDQAIPLSLIINELVTNAFKYAYDDDNNDPELIINLNKKGNDLELVVADNGKGVNMGEWKDKEGSFGKELIQTFVRQLNGHLDLIVDRGSRFTLTIPYTA